MGEVNDVCSLMCFLSDDSLVETFETILKQSFDELGVFTACHSLAFLLGCTGFPSFDYSG